METEAIAHESSLGKYSQLEKLNISRHDFFTLEIYLLNNLGIDFNETKT